MEGKTVLLTGATDGIGKEAAIALAGLGWRVIVHGRSTERAEDAAHDIAAAVPGAALETAAADLSSMAEVRSLADVMVRRRDHLDALVNNAGLVLDRPKRTIDGVEGTMAVNYLAAFLLTNLLLDLLRTARDARVVTVTSVVHRRGNPEALTSPSETFDGYQAYADSKLADVMFALELAERLAGTDVTSNAVHPGAVATKLLHRGFGPGGISPAEGARPLVMLASDSAMDGVTGRYFERMREVQPAPAALDPALRARLWQQSEQLLGLEQPFAHV